MFSDQSCVNRTETVHVEPCVSCFYSHPLYGMCVKIFIMNWYISKSYTATKNTIDRRYTEREKLLQLCQLLLVNNCVWRVRLMIHCYHRRSNWWMPVLRGYIVIIIIFIHHPRRNHSQLPAQHSPHYSLRLLLSCCLLQSYLHLDFLVKTLCMAADSWMWADTKFSLSFLGKFLFRCQNLCFLSRSSRRSFSHSIFS